MSIANKENVTFDELESISGTGANGRVSKKDILNYIKNREKPSSQSISKKRTVTNSNRI